MSFKIDDSKNERVKEAMAGLFPIPMIPDPDQKKNKGLHIPKFTKEQWARECVRQWIIKQVSRYETKVRIEKDAILNNPEDTLVS